jgi:amidase
MPDIAITRLSAREIANLIRRRRVSPVEVLQAHIAVIERLNPEVNAVVTLATEQALQAAHAAERSIASGDKLGPLHGLPVAIKDVTETAGIRTTYGSPLYRDHIPDADAEVVARLRKAGAIILAKTNTPEFAAGASTINEVFGATRNPWNLNLSPAGSSGGSAAAVATGMVPIAHGTDFGCSVRIPASFCGIVGIRPTPGLIPNDPLPLGWDPGQVHGALGRTVEDIALMLDSMVGFSPRSPISIDPPWKSALAAVEDEPSIRHTRIAYVADIAGIGVDPEVAAICRRSAKLLETEGAAVNEIAFEVADGRDAYLVWRGFWMVGTQFDRLDRIERFGANLSSNLRSGLKLTATDWARAEKKRFEVFHRFRRLFENYDVLVTPAAPVPPFPVSEPFPRRIGLRELENYMDWIAPAYLITLVGLPAVSVPAGLTGGRLPVGLQIVGPRLSEPMILRVARTIQGLTTIGWPPEGARSR